MRKIDRFFHWERIPRSDGVELKSLSSLIAAFFVLSLVADDRNLLVSVCLMKLRGMCVIEEGFVCCFMGKWSFLAWLIDCDLYGSGRF